MKTWILDTGPLVAYLDSDDRRHRDAASCLDSLRGQLVTTSAVITEAMHLVGDVRDGPRVLAEYVGRSGMQTFDMSSAPHLREAASLMERYENVPMDFADATLLLLAEALGLRDVITFDRRGFTVYRTRQRRALTILPSSR